MAPNTQTDARELIEQLVQLDSDRFNAVRAQTNNREVTLNFTSPQGDLCEIQEIDLGPFNLKGVVIIGLDLNKCALSVECLRNVVFRDCKFWNCTFTGNDRIRGLMFEDSQFLDCRFVGLNFGAIHVKRCAFTDIDSEDGGCIFETCTFDGFSAKGNAFANVSVMEPAQAKILRRLATLGIRGPGRSRKKK